MHKTVGAQYYLGAYWCICGTARKLIGSCRVCDEVAQMTVSSRM